MKGTALMIAGPIISALGLYFRYRKKSVDSWLSSRRIDQKEKVDTAICNECGAVMKRRTYKSGHREGSSALVCSNYPDCKNRVWGV